MNHNSKIFISESCYRLDKSLMNPSFSSYLISIGLFQNYVPFRETQIKLKTPLNTPLKSVTAIKSLLKRMFYRQLETDNAGNKG